MIENKDKWAREIAAQCWCDKETENKTMDVSLAMAVAKRIAFSYAEGRKAERERCLNVLKKYPDDGRELGDILEAIKLEIKGLI